MTTQDMIETVSGLPDENFLYHWHFNTPEEKRVAILHTLNTNGFKPRRLVTWIKVKHDADAVHTPQTKQNIIGALKEIERRG